MVIISMMSPYLALHVYGDDDLQVGQDYDLCSDVVPDYPGDQSSISCQHHVNNDAHSEDDRHVADGVGTVCGHDVHDVAYYGHVHDDDEHGERSIDKL